VSGREKRVTVSARFHGRGIGAVGTSLNAGARCVAHSYAKSRCVRCVLSEERLSPRPSLTTLCRTVVIGIDSGLENFRAYAQRAIMEISSRRIELVGRDKSSGLMDCQCNDLLCEECIA
jgi:hypothetical protein